MFEDKLFSYSVFSRLRRVFPAGAIYRHGQSSRLFKTALARICSSYRRQGLVLNTSVVFQTSYTKMFFYRYIIRHFIGKVYCNSASTEYERECFTYSQHRILRTDF